MTEAQRDDILLGLVSTVMKIDSKLDKNIEFTHQIAEKLDKNIEFTHQIAEKLDKNIEFTHQIAEKLDNNIGYTQRINESVVKIEVEHGDKLSALFDAVAINSEKIDELKADIKEIHSILDRHEDEIYLLKSKQL